jgi:hypothetical protein
MHNPVDAAVAQPAGVPVVVHRMHTPDDDVLIPFFIIEFSIPRRP